MASSGVNFSTSGDRLGYGEGIYDRFLSNIKGSSIGIAYDFQVIDPWNRDLRSTC